MSSVCLKSCSVESPYVVVCPARHRAQAPKLYHTRQRGEVLSRGRVHAYERVREGGVADAPKNRRFGGYIAEGDRVAARKRVRQFNQRESDRAGLLLNTG